MIQNETCTGLRRIKDITEAGGNEHINQLSHKYRGRDFKYIDGQIRVIYKIAIDRVTGE
jgi:hypothetical protein